MSTIKRVFLSFFCVLIVLSSFIFPASAVSKDFYFNVPNPADMSDGYIIVPNRSFAILYWWTITPVMTDVDSSGNLITSVDLSSDDINITFNKSVASSSVSYYVTLYSIYSGVDENPKVLVSRVVSNTSSITYSRSYVVSCLHPNAWSGIENLDFSTDLLLDANNFTYRYADNNAFYKELSDINLYLASLLECSSLSSEAIQTLITNTNNILTKLTSIDNNTSSTNEKLTTTITNLNSIITHFVSLLDKVDYTNEQLDDIVLKFSELLDVSYSISSTLDDFVYYYWEEFSSYTFPLQISEICGRLDLILKALNRSGDSEQTTADTSNIDNYVDIEQSLVHNDEAQSAINDMDVSITGKAYSFIWNLITRILNSHPEVFGLVIAILTLGFIALLLNR